MKKFLSLCLMILLSMNVYAAEQLDKIVAIVNNSVITQSELDQNLDKIKKQFAAQNTSLPPEAALRKQVLDQMVNRKIQLQIAEQVGIHVDDAQVDKAISHIAEQNHMTMSQFREQLKAAGLDYAEYRKDIHDQIVIQTLEEHEVASKVVITPQEVDDFMRSKLYQANNNKEYHIEDILIALPEAPTSQQIQDAKNRANALLTKIHQGLAFNQAAISESAGSKALQGGDLGWRKLAETPTAFADQIINMKAGDVAGPIQTPNGFHIIRLSGVRGTNSKTNKKEIQGLLFQRKMEEGIQAWITKIRSEAFINMNPDQAAQ